MVYVLMADGFEETELIVPVDILRRGGVQVQLVGVGGEYAVSSRGIQIKSDISIDDVQLFQMEMLVLPGGQPGVDHLWENERVRELVSYAASGGKLVAAICAAPLILGRLGVLSGRRATCYPGIEPELKGAACEKAPVVRDGNLITARGAGAAFDFGFALLEAIKDQAEAARVQEAICYIKS